MVIEEKTMRGLLWKLKMLDDISLEEADQIYSVVCSFSQAVMDISSQKSTFDVSEIYPLLKKDYPITALQDWYMAVARKISRGQRATSSFQYHLNMGTLGFVNVGPQL